MKNQTKKLGMLAILAGTLIAGTGCASRGYYAYGAPPPPPVRAGMVGRAPGPGYVWVDGYYDWRNRYVWVPGAWRRPPRPHAVWVPGRFEHHGRRQVWVGGRWRY